MITKHQKKDCMALTFFVPNLCAKVVNSFILTTSFLQKTIKNNLFVAYLRNIIYLCGRNYKEIEQTVFELDLLEEARDFLKSLTKEIRGKIGYNIRRVQKGERDNELFKKLDGTEIRKLYFENKNKKI